MRILVAMSGGVDSAVAAALLKQQGHDIVGVHMALLRNRDFTTGVTRGCCSLDDANDAREVCSILDIPFYVWDLSKDFHKRVIQDFLDEYKKGNTPNPCARCNQFIKFQTLLDKSQDLGFDKIATGHYAITDGEGLLRSKNIEKDQSYVLAPMGRNVIDKVVFPLGEFKTKQEVRKVAEDFGLPLKDKPDSTDICFIERGKTRQFLGENLGNKKGSIIDLNGTVLGEHNGAFLYTIGQRQGLDLKNPDISGKPRYVIKTDIEKNLVIVGMKEDLSTNFFEVKDIQLFTDSISDAKTVQVRAHGEVHIILEISKQEIENKNDKYNIKVDNPIYGIAKGQSCVGYKDNKVIFEATIC